MRIDLLQPLKPGGKYSFKIEWSYNVLDRNKTFAGAGVAMSIFLKIITMSIPSRNGSRACACMMM